MRAFAQTEIGRLEELRLAALEELIDAELALGRHAELVPELERSSPSTRCASGRGQLMLALYRSGRQAEALEGYQAARRVLVDELGIEPGRQLRELHQAILQQDAALDAEPAAEHDRRSRRPTSGVVRQALPRAEARKTVTAVCVGSPPRRRTESRSIPEALRRVTSRAFGEIEAAVERHGGTVETVAGDAIISGLRLADVCTRTTRCGPCGSRPSCAGALRAWPVSSRPSEAFASGSASA